MDTVNQGERIIAVLQARMTSTRLPGKVLMPLAGAPLLSRVIERVSRISGLDGIVVAIPSGDKQLPIVELVAGIPEVDLVSGSEDDVLDRTLYAATSAGATAIVRITTDCPLIDPEVSSAVLGAFRKLGISYARTAISHGYPMGFDTEVISVDALKIAASESSDPYEREHVTPFIWRQPERFESIVLSCMPDRRHWRLTVDTPEDYRLVSTVYDELANVSPSFGMRELDALFKRRPELLELNAGTASTPYIGLPSSYASS